MVAPADVLPALRCNVVEQQGGLRSPFERFALTFEVGEFGLCIVELVLEPFVTA